MRSTRTRLHFMSLSTTNANKKSVEMIHFCVAFHIDEKVMVNKTIDGRGRVYY
jgi:hypothetical protein